MEQLNYIIFFSVVYALIVILCYTFVLCKPLPCELRYNKKLDFIAGPMLLGLLLLQFAVSGLAPGHVQDTGLFRAWTAFAEAHPVWEYYKTELYVDYPPVYLYILYGLGKLLSLLHVDPASGLYLACIRSIPIVFDGLSTLLIYKIACRRLGQKKALAAALLCAINPARIVNSTIWGQVDSVTTFTTAVMLLALYKKKYVAGFSLLSVLFLTKPQTIMFAPLLCFTLFFDFVKSWRQPAQRKQMLIQGGLSVLCAVAVLLLVPLPITGGDYGLLIEKYKAALNLYPYATLNAPNLYGAIGGNWAADSGRLLFLPYKTWGFVFIVLISLALGFVSFKSRNRKHIFTLGIFTVLGIYMLGHGMHERYLAPALFLMLLVYAVNGDRRMLFFYAGFSLTTFIACAWVLTLNQTGAFIYGDNVWFRLLSWLNVVLFILWMFVQRRDSTSGAEKIRKRF